MTHHVGLQFWDLRNYLLLMPMVHGPHVAQQCTVKQPWQCASYSAQYSRHERYMTPSFTSWPRCLNPAFQEGTRTNLQDFKVHTLHGSMTGLIFRSDQL